MQLEKLSIEEKGNKVSICKNSHYFFGDRYLVRWISEGKMFIQSVRIKPLRGKTVRGGEILGGKRGLRGFT